MTKKSTTSKGYEVTLPPSAYMDEGVGRNKHEPKKPPVEIHAHLDVINGGAYIWEGNVKFPKKGVPDKRTMRALDSVKRSLRGLIEYLSSRPTRYLVILLLLSPWRKRIVNNFLEQYSTWTDFVLKDFYLKPIACCTMVRELHRVFTLMGLSDSEKRLATCVCMFLENDDAYRYRVQDFFGELNRGNFYRDPAKELRRVISLCHERDDAMFQGQEKWSRIGMLLSLMLWFKPIKERAILFMQIINLEKLALDDEDWYHCCAWNGYDFRGMSYSLRLAERIRIDNDPTIPRRKWPTENVEYVQ